MSTCEDELEKQKTATSRWRTVGIIFIMLGIALGALCGFLIWRQIGMSSKVAGIDQKYLKLQKTSQEYQKVSENLKQALKSTQENCVMTESELSELRKSVANVDAMANRLKKIAGLNVTPAGLLQHRLTGTPAPVSGSKPALPKAAAASKSAGSFDWSKLGK